MQHYTDFATCSEAFVSFAHCAREEGLRVGIDESRQSIEVALAGIWMQKPFFQFALASIFCTTPEERSRFEVIFSRFWTERGSRQKSQTIYKNQSNLRRAAQSTLAMLGTGKSNAVNHQAKTTSGANKKASLRKTDFAHVHAVDQKQLDLLCEQLVREMSLRLRRKFKQGKQAQIDIGQTIRQSMQHGGNLISLHHREKRKEQLKLVLLLDVSGSMDKYSFYLLRFIYSLRNHFRNIEVFTFSTSLLRITDYLHPGNLDLSLRKLGHGVDHWSSGTKIGASLKTFNDHYAKRMLNGRSQTIILSDGLDTGKPDQLAIQLKRIRLRTKRLIWLNPLKGMSGYQPIQRGMQAALPEIDIFQSAHNLESLLTLENIISNA